MYVMLMIGVWFLGLCLGGDGVIVMKLLSVLIFKVNMMIGMVMLSKSDDLFVVGDVWF